MAFSIIGAAGFLEKEGACFKANRFFLNSYLDSTSSDPNYPKEINDLSFFDLASLTKVLVTAPLVWEWAEKNGFHNLEVPVVQLSKELAEIFLNSSFKEIRLKDLLEHRGALRAHDLPWGERRFPNESRKDLWKEFLDFLKKEDPLTFGETVYSDLGFLTLGFFLESQTDKTLAELFKDSILSAASSGFCWGLSPESPFYKNCFPTEIRHPTGQVNDDKAASLAGVAPHSGLFGSIRSIENWLSEFASILGRRPEFEKFSKPTSRDFAQRFYWGWDQPSYEDSESQAGFPAPPGTLGHLGYTGTAFWWCPLTMQYGILLSNRVHPQHSAQSQGAIKKIRSTFFSALWQSSQSKDKLDKAWEIIKKISAGHT